eukprot:6175334-Pleurochrysis_carterae.AAC.2
MNGTCAGGMSTECTIDNVSRKKKIGMSDALAKLTVCQAPVAQQKAVGSHTPAVQYLAEAAAPSSRHHALAASTAPSAHQFRLVARGWRPSLPHVVEQAQTRSTAQAEGQARPSLE